MPRRSGGVPRPNRLLQLRAVTPIKDLGTSTLIMDDEIRQHIESTAASGPDDVLLRALSALVAMPMVPTGTVRFIASTAGFAVVAATVLPCPDLDQVVLHRRRTSFRERHLRGPEDADRKVWG